MASYDPEFYEAPKVPPQYGEPRPAQRGCFFYGCIFASVLSLLLIIGLGVVAYMGMRFVYRLADEWTSPAPVALPRVPLSEDERKSVRDRVDDFRKALEAGTAVEPLVLTGDDVNALIEDSAEFRDRVHVKLEGDKLRAQISVPLDKLGLPPFQGRYLNGEAELKASLNNGVLIVTLDSLQVNGKRLPDSLLSQLREQNLANDAYKNPRTAEMISRFESLRIEDGKIILEPRTRGKVPAGPGDARPPAHRRQTDEEDLPAEAFAPDDSSPAPK